MKNNIDSQLLDCFGNVKDRSNKVVIELADICSGIAFHQDLKTKVDSIRQGNDNKGDVLAVFIPSLYDGRPTGIVQLDYDEIKVIANSENLKSKFENVQSVIYAFISPSGGLKVGINTDFCGDDAEINKFKFAVEVVENDIRQLINEPGIKFDPSSRSINQPCFLSSDDKLIYNGKAEELQVRERADILFSQWEASQKARVDSLQHIHTISNDEIDSAFHAIPKDLAKGKRIIIETAVLNVFGADGIDMMINHFFFKNVTKARDGLVKLYEKTLRGGQTNRVGIRTILEEAKLHDWRNTTWSGRKTTGLEGQEPTYNCRLYPTVHDAVHRVQELISDYFRHGVDTLIFAECGLGKTRIVLEKIASINGNVAFFIPDHETADEIKKTLLSFGCLPDDIVIVHGYSKTCHKIQHLKDDEKVGLSQNWQTCLSCDHHNSGCIYHGQFDGTQRVRIYPHAYLFHPASADRFKPDFVIIDESITENICDISSYKRNDSKIFQKMIDKEPVTSEEIDSEIDNIHKIFRSQKVFQITPPPSFFFDSDAWKDELQKNKRFFAVYKKHHHLIELKKIIEGMHSEYVTWTAGGRFFFGKKKQIDPRWLTRPILHLDASGDRKISEIAFDKDFQVYEKIRCNYADGVRVIQIFDKLFSKGQCSDAKTISDLKWFVSMLEDDQKIGYIGYKQIDGKPFISDLIANKNLLLWFGGLRGKNKLENAGCDTLIGVGRHMLARQELINVGHVLFRADDFVSTTATVKKTYRMADGNHLTGIFVEYADERLQALAEVFDKAETYQAGHRARLLHKSGRTLILLTNEVLDFTIDELVSLDQIIPTSDKRRALIEAIKKHDGQISFTSNSDIMVKANLDLNQVKNLKRDKEWIQRNFWFYVDDAGMFRFQPANNHMSGGMASPLDEAA